MSLQVSTQKGDFTISNQTTILIIVKKKQVISYLE